MRYVDYINVEIERKLKNPQQFTNSEIGRLRYAKKIKRNQMLDISVEILSNK